MNSNDLQSKNSVLQNNLYWIIATIAITCVSMMTSMQPIWANIPFNVFLAVIILLKCNLVFFERMKLITLTVIRLAIVAAVFIPDFRNIYVIIVLVFLGINILEATFTDLIRYKRIFNGITGLALTVSVVFLSLEWIDISQTTSLFGNFSHIYTANAATFWGTIAWIIAYTLWNWIFVTNEFSTSIARLHVGILLAPIIGCIIFGNPGYWLVFRANSLTFGGCFQIVEKQNLEERFKSAAFEKFVASTKTNASQCVLMLVNLALIAVTIFF